MKKYKEVTEKMAIIVYTEHRPSNRAILIASSLKTGKKLGGKRLHVRRYRPYSMELA
jgi:hypothetical protein